MINLSDGKVEIKGSGVEIMADVAFVIKKLSEMSGVSHKQILKTIGETMDAIEETKEEKDDDSRKAE